MSLKSILSAASSLLALALLVQPAQAQTKEPIRIGVPVAMSGPLATIGAPTKRAVDFALNSVNAKGGIGGRLVEARFADTEANPDVARKQVEKLALDGYRLLFGTITSGEGLVVAPMLKRINALLVSPYSKSIRLIGDACQARFFRTTPSDPMELAVVKAWLSTRSEKKWIVIANDYAFGHDATDGFNAAAKLLGREVAGNLYPPFGTTDYAPYIQQIKAAGVDSAFVVLAGRDAINFLTQGKQFGLVGSLPMGGLIYTQDDIIAPIGLDTVGLQGNMDYSASLETPENKAFVAAWKAMYNGVGPTDTDGLGYTGLSILLQAIEKAGSSDPDAVAKALSGGSFTTPFGTLTMRAADHQLIMPVFFGQVKNIDGKPHTVVNLEVPAEQATPPVDPACKM